MPAVVLGSMLLAAVSLFLGTVSAQTTDAKCDDRFKWMTNSRNQSPCLVAAYLQQPCSASPVLVPALPPNNHYLGPRFADSNPCLCNTVTYSALSACGACQDRLWTNWTNWTLNCPQVVISSYPKAAPAEVEIPVWASLDVTSTNNNFDLVAAQRAVVSPSSSSTSSTASSSSSAGSELPAITSPAEAKKPVNAGAIAGGVVGGVFFLVVIAILGLWIYSGRRNPLSSGSRANTTVDLNAGDESWKSPGMSEYNAALSTRTTSPYHTQPDLYRGNSIYTTMSGTRTSHETLPAATIPPLSPQVGTHQVPEI